MKDKLKAYLTKTVTFLKGYWHYILTAIIGIYLVSQIEQTLFLEFLVSKFFFVVPMFIGGFAFWLLTRFVSWGTGITRQESKEAILNGNVAMACYLGLRVLAIGVAVGLFVLAGASI